MRAGLPSGPLPVRQERLSPVCDRQQTAKGLCGAHLQRLWKTGDAKLLKPIRPMVMGRSTNIWDSVIKGEGCWEWTGPHDAFGYGMVRSTRVHRVLWEMKNGPVPAGMHMDHFACDNKGCCNPDHVRPVSPRENVLRSENSIAAVNAAKTKCPRGHEYTAGDKGRVCKPCHGAWRRLKKQRDQQRKDEAA